MTAAEPAHYPPQHSGSPLWDAIENWRHRRNVHVEQIANFRTRAKIKKGRKQLAAEGSRLRSDVFANIDRVLGWEPGDALRAWLEDLPPRPVEGHQDDNAAARMEVMRVLGSAVAATGTATDEAVRRARLQAEEILRTLKS